MKIRFEINLSGGPRKTDKTADYYPFHLMFTLFVVYLHMFFELVHRDWSGTKKRLNLNIYYGLGSGVDRASKIDRFKHFSLWPLFGKK